MMRRSGTNVNSAGDKIFASGFLICSISLLIRWSVALHSYSGKSNAPIYGDYEAQRHWMEVTVNLPPNQWFINSTNNDLHYWGLDYPPLTAYHSYLFGRVAGWLNPKWIELHTSRGFQNYRHKLFMRSTVLVSDILYMVAVWYLHKSDKYRFLSLIYPGLILIDHGHFQYNCLSLGLFVSAVIAIGTSHHFKAAFLFTLAVNFKQMELYHALPFFCFYIGKFLIDWKKSRRKAVGRLLAVATVVCTTFIVLWSPFVENPLAVLKRIFPVSRGLYEDKVANFWCFVNIFYKFRRLNEHYMVKLCTATTLASVSPSLVHMIRTPSTSKFKWSLVNCALGFFLFSFHVHEKSILLAVVPALLLYAEEPFAVFWFSLTSVFSMAELLIKDGLFAPAGALLLLYYISYFAMHSKAAASGASITPPKRLAWLFYFSIFGFIVLSMLLRCNVSSTIPRYPHLWSLLLAVYSFFHFVGFFLYFYIKQFGILFFNDKFD